MKVLLKPSELSDVPTFKIGAVSKLTGISLHLLRLWERRYGVVEPERTSAGGRLYSKNHVDRLTLIKGLCEQGYAIGQVAQMSTDQLLRVSSGNEDGGVARVDLGEAVEAFVEQIRVNRSDEAREVVERALRRAGPRAVAMELFLPALRSVGALWEGGELSVAQEHLASALVRGYLGAFLKDANTSVVGPLVLSTTGPGELHEFGALVASIEAATSGFRVMYLGPNLPVREVVRFAEETLPFAVMVSLVSRGGPVTMTLRALRRGLPDRVKLVVGGEGLSEVRSLPKGVIRVDDIAELRSQLKRVAGVGA